MNNAAEIITEILKDNILKIIFSNTKTGVYHRIEIHDKSGYFQVAKLTKTQVFHENIDKSQLYEYCCNFAAQGFRQLNAWGQSHEHIMKVSEKGKPFYSKKQTATPPKVNTEHNRKKSYILQEGERIEPLVDLGIFSKDYRILNSMYDKYKQINKFAEIIDDTVKQMDIENANQNLNIIDFGCGKSYLTFIVYYYFKYIKNINVNMTGLDLRQDVIDKCNEIAEKYRYENLRFEVGNIEGYKTEKPIDMVISLHACDTATDYALYNAVTLEAKAILSVPCCQHELNSMLKSSTLPIIQRYGIIKERTAALMTDAIRANLLEYCGYKTSLLDFVDLSHTPKNILIRAIKTEIPKSVRENMIKEVRQLAECFNLEPTLLKLIGEEI